MPRSKATCFLLPGPAAAACIEKAEGNLAAVRVTQTAALIYTRLDFFDQPLRRSGRMLIDTGTALNLTLPDGATITQPQPRRERFVADLQDGPVKQALADLSPLRCLMACGTGTLTGATLGFVDDAGKTRCRATQYSLTSSDGTDVTLIWLHGLRGYGPALADVARRLKAGGAAKFCMEAVYQHLWARQTMPQTRPKVVLTADQTAFETATLIIARHLPVARLNEPGIIADLDTEFLHDYRVALRKIRSALSLFQGVYDPAQTADLKSRFSTLMAQTGPLRDLDVQRLEQPATYDMVPHSLHDGLDAMAALRKTERARALTQLARHLSSTRYAHNMDDLVQLFTTPGQLGPGQIAAKPAQDLCAALIWKRFQKARQIAGALDRQTPDTEVHALRIHCKKLRYLMEFAATLYPAPALKPAIKTLKLLQDHLGVANDIAVQLANLQTFLHGADARNAGSRLQIAQSGGALITVLYQRKLAERHKTETAVAALASRQTEKIFRDLFHRTTPKPRIPNP